MFDSSNDTEQVSQSETKEDKENDKYMKKQEDEREQEEAVYTKNAPKKVTFEKDDYDGAGVLTKYNMRNGYKYNYYKDSDGDYFYYSINDKKYLPADRRYLYEELTTITGNEKYAKTHKKDTKLLVSRGPFPPSYDLSKLENSGIYTTNPPKRDAMRGGILSSNFNRQKGYQVNYYYGTFKTPNNVKDPISSDSKQYGDTYYYYNSDGEAISLEGDYIKTAEDDLKNNPDKLLQQ